MSIKLESENPKTLEIPMNNELEQLVENVDALIASLDRKREIIAKSEQSEKALIEQVTSLKAEIAVVVKDNPDLAAVLAEKDAQIAALAKQLEDQKAEDMAEDQQITSLYVKVKERLDIEATTEVASEDVPPETVSVEPSIGE